MSQLKKRLCSRGPKRMLALDGGGIRGAITIGYLQRLEAILKRRYRNPNYRLSDYFDLIGGTSTGAIIASGLAIGMSADEIKELYLKLGGKIFSQKTGILKRLNAKFKINHLRKELEKIFGDITLGDERIKTGLCLVTKRADTGSTWPLINHPDGKFFKDNKDILLRNAIRASTAAPTYFEPETIDVGGGQIGAFVDGGVSMHNNPSLLLFLLATLKGYPFHWRTGADKLMLVSIGTGSWSHREAVDDVTDNKLWDWASDVVSLLMNDAKQLNQIVLQYLSNSPNALTIDSEIGDMRDDLLTNKPKLHFLRYDAVLSDKSLNRIGVHDVNWKELREMSAAKNRFILSEIGEKAAKKEIKTKHLPEVFDTIKYSIA